MKYTILINQKAVADAGLADHTDLTDWAIIDYIMTWYANPKAQRLGNKVWVNYKHLIAELPLLTIKTKQGISKRIQRLVEHGLINIEYDDSSRIYIEPSNKLIDLLYFEPESGNSEPRVSTPENAVSTPANRDPSTDVDIQHTISSKQSIRSMERPTQNQVGDYMFSKGLTNHAATIESQKFIDHYTANGWKVGKNPMKDWQAAVRNWMNRIKPQSTRERDLVNDLTDRSWADHLINQTGENP